MEGLLHSGYTRGDPGTGFWQVVVATGLLDELLQPVREKGRYMRVIGITGREFDGKLRPTVVSESSRVRVLC